MGASAHLSHRHTEPSLHGVIVTMNAQGLSAYLNLIQALINCPEGEEWDLLRHNEARLTPEFLQVMGQVASELATEGDVDTANYLHAWKNQIAQALQRSSPSPQHDHRPHTHPLHTHQPHTHPVHPPASPPHPSPEIQLIQALLSCPKGGEEALLQANRDRITPEFLQALRQVAAQLHSQGHPDTANFLWNWAKRLSPDSHHPAEPPNPEADPDPDHPDHPDHPLHVTQWFQPVQPPIPPLPLFPRATHPAAPPETPSTAPTEVSPEDNAPTPPSEPIPSELPIAPESIESGQPSLQIQLATIAQALTQLEATISKRLPPIDPLWYMPILERAHSAQWVLTTEELEHLIGIKPKCLPGSDRFHRGCWVFVKAGKTGSQTGWRILKEVEAEPDAASD